MLSLRSCPYPLLISPSSKVGRTLRHSLTSFCTCILGHFLPQQRDLTFLCVAEILFNSFLSLSLRHILQNLLPYVVTKKSKKPTVSWESSLVDYYLCAGMILKTQFKTPSWAELFLLGAILSSVSGKALSSLQSFGLNKGKASMAEKHPITNQITTTTIMESRTSKE